MANSYTKVVSSGQATYTAPAYLAQAHVTVYVDNVSVTFTWDSATIVRPDVTPTSGEVVWVQRATPDNTLVSTLSDGAVDSATHYNNIALQMLYRAQEIEEQGTKWHFGDGVPSAEPGETDGDFYLNSGVTTPADKGDVWELIDGTWTEAGAFASTPASWVVQAGAPDDGADGIDGDMYINTTTDEVFGPKAAGAWGAAVADLTGATGAPGADSDMLVATYDPTAVAGDAFDMDNMAEGTNLILSAAERSKLAAVEASADVTDAVNVGAINWAAAGKATPVDADTIVLADTAAANVIKKTTWTQVKAFLKTYFDTLYNLYTHPNHTGDVTSTADGATVIAAGKVTAAMRATAAVATLAQFRTKTADVGLDADIVYAAAAEVTLSDGATITVDMDTFINAKVTLAGNRTLGNPTNEDVGQSGYIRIIQDGTGTRTLAYGTDWEFAGGTAPVLATTAADEDVLHYVVLAANRILGSLSGDIS